MKLIKIIKNTLPIIILAVFFSYIYFSNHTYGALGDDSPGYIFIASRYLQNEKPVFIDPLISDLIEEFGHENIRFALPHYGYRLIGLDGKIAPITPLGFPVLMALLGNFFGEKGFYYLNPLSGVLLLLGVYFLVLQIFINEKRKKIFAFFTVLLLGTSIDFWSYITMEPLRDVPAVTFLIWSFFFLYKGLRGRNLAFILFSGAMLGASINIRETSVVAIPALGLIFLNNLSKLNKKFFLKSCTVFIFTSLIVFSFSVYNNYLAKNEISIQNGQLLASNIDHVKSLSFKNMVNNQGKFRPGQGGLKIYYSLIKDYFCLPNALFFIIIAQLYLLHKNPKLGLFFLVWIFSFFLFFSMWVNPYHRYIFPIFPALAILLVYGLYLVLNFISSEIFVNKRERKTILLLIFLLINLYSFPAYERFYNLIIQKDSKPSQRSITQEDFNLIKNINLQSDKPLLIFLGNSVAYAAYIEAHTNIRSIRGSDTNNLLEIINYLSENNYEIYIWNDKSDMDNYDLIIDNYLVNKFIDLNFSYGNVEIVKLNNEVNKVAFF